MQQIDNKAASEAFSNSNANPSLQGKTARKKKPKSFIALGLITLGQFFALHSVWIKRGIILAILILAIFIIYQTRDMIVKTSSTLSSIISAQFAANGFAIEEVVISGQSLTTEKQIVGALTLEDNNFILTFDAKLAQKKILQLPAVKTVTVRKSFPSKLIINLQETLPIAQWRVGGETFFIDENGNRLSVVQETDENNLLLLIGLGAADNAKLIIDAIAPYPTINEGLVALSKIAERRWDLIYDNGLRVQLPESDLQNALANLNDYQKNYSIFNKDIDLIDLRVKDSLVVRLIKRDDDTNTNQANELN